MTNILFLMTDQQRWDALSASGDWVKTPALDRIRGGRRVFYAVRDHHAQSACRPA